MVREWTDEQREAQRQRALAQGFGSKVRSNDMEDKRERTGAKASVTMEEVPPVPFRRPRSHEAIIAEEQGRIETSEERTSGEDGQYVTTTHAGPRKKVMYKPIEGRGYEPRRVAGSAVGVLLAMGWAEWCPDCNNEHLDKNGQPSTDPNLCKARPPVAVRECPVCGKRIYDNIGAKTQAAESADPNVIQESGYNDSTPESRTKATLDIHMWQKHPRQAQMMGVPPLPAAILEDLFGGKPV